MTKPFLRAMAGEQLVRPPVWLMRQAGRYLPEYREIRAKTPSFLEFCYSPKLAAEATLQPIRRFGFDAAIMFSDILVVPDAMGQKVWFETGEGPKLEPVASEAEIGALHESDVQGRLSAMFETLALTRAALPDATALIGFCGAPWTVASYMIAGHGTPDQAPARLYAYRHPDLFQTLVDKLVKISAAYLCGQIRAGADAVQIFDSWAGVLPAGEFERWCLAPVRAMVDLVRAEFPDVPIIAFPRGAGARLPACARALGVRVLGLDTAIDPAWADQAVETGITLQGNLDPLALVAGGAAQDRAVDYILHALRNRPHIFNLGHGILPHTPLAHVEQLLARLRRAG